jgi:alcohol dehydrogenase class IV
MRLFPDQSFNFLPIPTDIHFGVGVVRQLPDLLKLRVWERVFVVTDPGVLQAGVVEKVTCWLDEASVDFVVYGDVGADSGSHLIEEATRQAKDYQPDVIMGIGGGSSLDTAKAVGLMATAPGPLLSYLGLGKVRHSPMPIVAIPTTAGTGSEVTLWSVFTDDDTGAKVAIGSVELYPKVAVCDPELTVTLPASTTAETGMDALAHAIECYTNNACQPISGALSLTAIELIGKYLRRAVQHGREDLQARYQILLASTMAGMAMNSTRLGLVHALAMPLGSHPFRIPHGLGNAITLPHVMEFNAESEPERFASVAAALGSEPSAYAAVEAVRSLGVDLSLPSKLSAVGFRGDSIPAIAAEAIKSGNVAVNPRRTCPEDLARILEAAL